MGWGAYNCVCGSGGDGVERGKEKFGLTNESLLYLFRRDVAVILLDTLGVSREAEHISITNGIFYPFHMDPLTWVEPGFDLG